MMLFQKGEELNRAVTIGTAKAMAGDLLKNSSMAWKAVNNFPVSVRKQIKAAVDAGDQVQTFQTVAKYLNDTAQFNYNRSSLFEFGRTMGPILSTFSKWPTAIAGELLYELRSKGAMAGAARSLERLVVPFAGLAAMDAMLFGGGAGMGKMEIPDRIKKLTGAGGIEHVAPIGALKEFTGGKIFSPPAVDVAMKGLITPALEGNPAKLGHGLDTLLYNYTPGSGLVRFLTDDLVTYATGNRPEGSTFVERTASGLNQIAK
jgi:hypothetical protein